MLWAQIVSLALLMGAISPARAAVYYLNTVSGNDGNPGTADRPWKTLGHVQSAAASSDTVCIQQADAATYAAAWPDHVSYKATSLQQFGITWRFNDYYAVGKFANGDFWVVGPVKITTITPRSTLVSGRIMNGSMVNPSPTAGAQGYDNQMPNAAYREDLNVAFNVSEGSPLELAAHSSLVSTISIETRVGGNDTQLLAAAVLTVLPSAAAAGSFRPAYSGTDKTIRFNKTTLDYSLLKSLPPVPNTPTLSFVEGLFEKPWIDHIPTWVGRFHHPRQNMPEYGREIHRDISNGAMMLHLNFTNQEKETLLIRYVQLGIDLYGIVDAGGIGNWGNDGGHGGGRKWPILFAGLILHDANMKAIGQKSGDYLSSEGYGPGNCPPDYIHFGEDDQTFHVGQFEVTLTSKDLHTGNTWSYYADSSGITGSLGVGNTIVQDTTGATGTIVAYRNSTPYYKDIVTIKWNGSGSDFNVSNRIADRTTGGYFTPIGRTRFNINGTWQPDDRTGIPAPYTEDDLGLPEWGIRHSTHPAMSNRAFTAIYRSVASPAFQGTALAALLMDGAKELWNHDAYFDYTDRYMAATLPGGEGYGYERTFSAFTNNMWDTYRAQCGPVWPETGSGNTPVLSLIGDKQITQGQTLTFTVTGTDANGDTLTFSAAGLPAGATFSNRTFTWTPASGQIGEHEVTFTVSDGSAEDSETITITVERQNAAPVLAGIGGKNTHENQAISFAISATDADGDTIAYSASGLPAGATLTGQTFSWTPGYDQAGNHSVTFVASDGRAQDSETITISVTNVNRAPTLAGIGDRSVDENETLSFALSATDPDGTALTYSATGLPTGANLAGGNFTWTPTDDQIGSYEITFVASDGTATDSETITVAVVSTMTDQAAPAVARQSPAAGAIQVPLNNLITLHVTDAGRGVDAASVRITIDGEVVYEGNTAAYAGASGRCSRLGAKNDYEFVYQHDQMFDFDHMVTVTVNAADRAGNVMNKVTYSFATEMRAFGSNKLASGADMASTGAPATAGDAAGNIWAAWHAGPEDARDIYVARLRAGQDVFDAPVQVTTDSGDQCNPDIALAHDGSLFVVWQDNRRGNWDVFLSTTSNGETFTRETLIEDSDNNQTEPVVAVDGASPSRAYVAWQDDRNGNQDIFVASSTNVFASMTTSAVTTNTANQTSPDMAVDAANTAYLVWTDSRNGQADIYGAASTASWANVPLVTGDGGQTHPAVAATPGSSVLHLLWVNDVSGDADVYYASSNGLPTGPVTGTNIIDDTSDAAQTDPALACAADGRIFACWQDARNVGVYGDDTDVYFTELGSDAGRTNILIDDEGNGANQFQPAIAVTADDQPYIIWADDRNVTTEIYCAATTSIDPTPLYSTVVAAATGATVGTDPAAINGSEDVSVVVPPGACPTDLRITISKILNPLISPADCLGSYDFGPSGVDFDQPVTVTIPYEVSEGDYQAQAYWYNSLTGALSQQGITDIENITISDNVYALRFKTTHFTPYYVVADDAQVLTFSSNDGGGGCSVSTSADGSPRHLLVPYGIVVVAMVILRRRDRRRAIRCVER
ncbi:MAG: putative Ig domain-containing protein [Phycisphaerales bacterium]